MRIITLYIALTLMTVMSLSAQTDNKAKDSTFVETLSTEKEHIIQEEKDALKREVEKINSNIENGSVSKEEAEELKRKAAQKHALNIENRNVEVCSIFFYLFRSSISDLFYYMTSNRILCNLKFGDLFNLIH